MPRLASYYLVNVTPVAEGAAPVWVWLVEARNRCQKCWECLHKKRRNDSATAATPSVPVGGTTAADLRGQGGNPLSGSGEGGAVVSAPGGPPALGGATGAEHPARDVQAAARAAPGLVNLHRDGRSSGVGQKRPYDDTIVSVLRTIIRPMIREYGREVVYSVLAEAEAEV